MNKNLKIMELKNKRNLSETEKILIDYHSVFYSIGNILENNSKGFINDESTIDSIRECLQDFE